MQLKIFNRNNPSPDAVSDYHIASRPFRCNKCGFIIGYCTPYITQPGMVRMHTQCFEDFSSSKKPLLFNNGLGLVQRISLYFAFKLGAKPYVKWDYSGDIISADRFVGKFWWLNLKNKFGLKNESFAVYQTEPMENGEESTFPIPF